MLKERGGEEREKMKWRKGNREKKGSTRKKEGTKGEGRWGRFCSVI